MTFFLRFFLFWCFVPGGCVGKSLGTQILSMDTQLLGKTSFTLSMPLPEVIPIF